MQWPERPTCHDDSGHPYARPEFMIWRAPEWNADKRIDIGPYEETFRTCAFCGSIHPEDLVSLLRSATLEGSAVRLKGSDWTYGWPHKFYVEGIPNPRAGAIIPIYAYCGLRERLGPNAERYTYPDGLQTWREKTGEYPAPPTQGAKWYNQHFLDAGYDDEALLDLQDLVWRFSGISFSIVDGKLEYHAPARGYSRWA